MEQDAIVSKYPQVRAFAERNKLRIEDCRIETIKKWIYAIKEIKRKLEKIPRNDIRIFLLHSLLVKHLEIGSLNLCVMNANKHIFYF